MRSPQGYVCITDPDAAVPVVERDTITCGHCQQIIEIKPGTGATTYLIFDTRVWQYHEEPGAFCPVCMRHICLQCHARGRCVPWERMIERMEARHGWWRTFLALGG